VPTLWRHPPTDADPARPQVRKEIRRNTCCSTPTGHRYASRPLSAITAPNTVPRPVARPPQDSRMEAHSDTLLLHTG
jgi:hypothetical protein